MFRTRRGEEPDLNCSLTAKTLIRQIENRQVENMHHDNSPTTKANLGKINDFWEEKKSLWIREKTDL